MDGGFGPVRVAAAVRSAPYGCLAPPPEAYDPEVAEVCQFFVKVGWCKFGSACRYAHVGESKPPEICQFFAKAGWCKWADQCRHLHIDVDGEVTTAATQLKSDDELMAECIGPDDFPEMPAARRPLAGGQEVCQFFSRAGWCKWGDICKHRHVGAGGGAVAATLATLAVPVQRTPAGLTLPPLAVPRTGELCEFFRKAGWCKWGDGCRHIHAAVCGAPVAALSRLPAAGATAARDLLSGSGRPALSSAPPRTHVPVTIPARQAPQATRTLLSGTTSVCKFFNQPAGCKNGHMCAFAHIGTAVPQESCQFFAKAGWCKWGDECRHAHDGVEAPPARPLVAPPAARALAAAMPLPPHSSGEVCQFFVKAGWCKWGEQCKHIHAGGPAVAAGVPLSSPTEPCQFFAKAGWCKWGDNCRYIHDLGADSLGVLEIAPLGSDVGAEAEPGAESELYHEAIVFDDGDAS